MSTLCAPDVLAAGRWWSGDQLDAMARVWRAAVLERFGETDRPIAAAVAASPESVALFVALTSLPSPVILLSTDPRAWRTEPPIPIGTPIALSPTTAHLAPEAERFGLVPLAMPDASARAIGGAPVTPLDGPGVIVFTSGSTGAPKPVFTTTAALLRAANARNRALTLERGAGALIGSSPAHGQGIQYLACAISFGGPLGLLDPRDHRLALKALAQPVFRCWRAAPHLVEAVSRCALTGPPVVPPLCILGTPIAPALFDAFQDRFGVPLRQGYSSTETGIIAVDNGPPADVRPDTVGRPVPDVELCFGEHPGESRPSGETGRIWIRSPWQMAGYGFPPHVDRPGVVDGWWPTRDLGMMTEDGRLTLAGRLDDAVRTRDNRVVNLALVASHLRDIPGVVDAVVIPLDSPSGRSFGAVVECVPWLSVEAIRGKLAVALPPWSWPRVVEIVPALPRLSNGKADRRACGALLGQALPS